MCMVYFFVVSLVQNVSESSTCARSYHDVAQKNTMWSYSFYRNV